MKNTKAIFSILFVAVLFILPGCKNDDDNPVSPDYDTYSFENFLLTDSVELISSNGYSLTVTLNRSDATQADDITLELTDPSGKFGFSNGEGSSTVTFELDESSKVITIQPIAVSDVSLFETYNLTVNLVPPTGTASKAEFEKSVVASVAVDFQPINQGHVNYGWGLAATVYGVAEKDFDLEKDSNVEYYKCLSLYADGYDILFGIDNGNVMIEDQRMMTTDPALFGAALVVLMKVTATSYDSSSNTVSITYDIVREDGGIFAGVPLDNLTDTIILP